MRRQAALIVAALAVAPAGTWAQQENFDGASPPASWAFLNDAALSEPDSTGNRTVVLPRRQALVLSDRLDDLESVEFVLLPPPSGQPFSLVVEALDETGNPVRVLETVDHERFSGQQGRALTIATTVDRIEPTRVRWRVEALSGEPVRLDAVRFRTLSPARRSELQQKALLEATLARMQTLVHEQTTQLSLTEAREYRQIYADQLPHLLDIRAKARTVTMISGIANATMHRGRLANPANYERFNALVNHVNTLLPETQRSWLADLLSPFVRGAGRAVEASVLGPFTYGIKSLVAGAFTRSSLEDAGISRGQREQAQRDGPRIFGDVRAFLEVMMVENQKTAQLQAQLDAITARSRALSATLDLAIREYLQAGGVEPTERLLASLYTSQVGAANPAIAPLQARLWTQFIQRMESGPNAVPAQERRLALERLRTSIAETERLRSAYIGLSDAMAEFFASFEQSVAGGNPFDAGSSEAAFWDATRTDALRSLQEARQIFQEDYRVGARS